MGRHPAAQVAVETVVPAPAADVWARVTTFEGVRDELRPYLSMTVPPGLRGKTLADADEVLGQPLGKSWVLLFGLLPVDYDDMRIVGHEPGGGFHERSRMLLLPRWEHQRTVAPDGDGATRVCDVLRFQPRIFVPARLVEAIVRVLFTHRHRRLARRFGAR